ncbi:uncharacterized protein TNIN_179591 [Trichonephila inaurata madagascariensis]|uniref:Uncharacterized protein n=1 Tax=Trichonephila inaurata madagascariensis TaxID=2747483 RepID=A0A8X6Y9R2_9ARAC|nr:uncharacterized protein TNIN_179591 [Trichonephila inaurata madagascariensis]
MERRIDRHEDRRVCRATLSSSKIPIWRDMWTQCFEIVKDFPTADLKQSHGVMEMWITIMNQSLDFPIRDIGERYNFVYFYCDEPNGPKEVIHLYFDENTTEEGKITVYVIFNLYEFRKIHRNYCLNYTKNNQMLVDEARGTVNLTAYYEGGRSNPAHYFQNLITWYLYFIFVLHAMAHLDTYDKFDHAQYDTHVHLKESPFFKIYFYGRVTFGR